MNCDDDVAAALAAAANAIRLVLVGDRVGLGRFGSTASLGVAAGAEMTPISSFSSLLEAMSAILLEAAVIGWSSGGKGVRGEEEEDDEDTNNDDVAAIFCCWIEADPTAFT